MKRIITLTGLPGSGKSSTAKGVAAALGYNHLSSGDIFRQMAAERGLSIEAMNQTAEEQQQLDHELDEKLRTMYQQQEGFVIDSRLAFHWMPEAFKVFLDLDPHTAAERTFQHIQKEGRESQTGSSVDEVYKNTVARIESEKKRYRALYDIDYTNPQHFDLVVDTGKNKLQEVIDIIVAAYRKRGV